MPELPDLQVFAKNLEKAFKGKKLKKITVVKAADAENSQEILEKKLEGSTLKKVYRSGKELRFQFDDIVLGMHLMLHGNLFIFEKENTEKHVIAEFLFSNKNGLVLTDWQKKAAVKLDPADKKGLDALDKKLNAAYLEKVLQSRAIIKNLLIDQDVIRGIGNAYADEILWKAGIAPTSVSKVIPAKKIKDLAKSIKSVLSNAEKQILKTHPDLVTGEVRDFLKIHNPELTHSPGGAPIKVDKKGGRSTYYTEEQELYK